MKTGRCGGGVDQVHKLPGIDTSKANIARVYDYWLGGNNNFVADQDAAAP
jgi:hypothetical protein